MDVRYEAGKRYKNDMERQGEILAVYFVRDFSENFDNSLETIRECE